MEECDVRHHAVVLVLEAPVLVARRVSDLLPPPLNVRNAYPDRAQLVGWKIEIDLFFWFWCDNLRGHRRVD
jgi:hypothetical protein